MNAHHKAVTRKHLTVAIVVVSGVANQRRVNMLPTGRRSGSEHRLRLFSISTPLAPSCPWTAWRPPGRTLHSCSDTPPPPSPRPCTDRPTLLISRHFRGQEEEASHGTLCTTDPGQVERAGLSMGATKGRCGTHLSPTASYSLGRVASVTVHTTRG